MLAVRSRSGRRPSALAAPPAPPRPLGAISPLPLLILLLLSGFAVLPALTTPIEAHAYDAAYFHVYRAVLYAQAWGQGVLYPRWVQPIDAGLGGPLFDFYAPGVYAALAALHLAGLPFTIAWRVVVALSLVVGATGAYLLALALAGRRDVAVVAGVAFAYAPYLLRDLFERGSPQGMAITLFPWILWALVRAYQAPFGLHCALAALLLGAALLIHAENVVFLLPFLALVGLLVAGDAFRLRALLSSALGVALGVLLAAVYLVPFLAESKDVQLANIAALYQADVLTHVSSWRDLLLPPGPLDIGFADNTLGDDIGPLQAFILALGMPLGVFAWLRGRRLEGVVLLAVAALCFAMLWLQTAPATPVWRQFPALDFVQTRGRLLAVVPLAVALVVALAGRLLPERWPRSAGAAGLAAVALVASQLPFLYPALLFPYVSFPRDLSPAAAEAFALRADVPGLTASNEFLPVWRHTAFTAAEAARVRAGPIANLPAGAVVRQWAAADDRFSAAVDSPTAWPAALHVLYFPGWVCRVNGQVRPIRPEAVSGYILVDLPAGRSSVTLQYEGTPAQRAGALLSLLSALALGALAALAVLRRPRAAKVRVAFAPLRAHWPVLLGLAALLVAKTAWVDGRTTLLRQASSCAHIARPGVVQTDVQFGAGLRLCGYRLLSPATRPGGEVQVVLYWEALRPVALPLKSFVHLLGASINPRSGNPLWGQEDELEPAGHPVVQWPAGKLFADSYAFRVDPAAPAGCYDLELGWYGAADAARLPPTIRGPAPGLRRSPNDSLLLSSVLIR